MVREFIYKEHTYDVIGTLLLGHNQYLLFTTSFLSQIHSIRLEHDHDDVIYKDHYSIPNENDTMKISSWPVEQYLLSVYLKKIYICLKQHQIVSLKQLKLEIKNFANFILEYREKGNIFTDVVRSNKQVKEKTMEIEQLLQQYHPLVTLSQIYEPVYRPISDEIEIIELDETDFKIDPSTVFQRQINQVESQFTNLRSIKKSNRSSYHRRKPLLSELIPAFILSCVTGTIGLTSLLFIVTKL